jgi:transposase
MEAIVERPAALDVHKAQVTACVRTPAAGGEREAHLAEFPTTVAGLLTLHDWLTSHGVTQVTMEATGVYWKPVWAILEDSFELLLVNARHVKQVPGRKTDMSDAAWLCQLAEAGLARASFVPPKPIRTLRNLTRYRKTQIQERAREANRLHKALEDTGIKLDCVATGHPRRLGPRDARRARGRHDRPPRARRPRQRPAAREDPGATRGARGPR